MISFFYVHRQLHFIENRLLPLPDSPNYDKIGKGRYVLDLIGQQFIAVYNPNPKCTINEAMTLYKGRRAL